MADQTPGAPPLVASRSLRRRLNSYLARTGWPCQTCTGSPCAGCASCSHAPCSRPSWSWARSPARRPREVDSIDTHVLARLESASVPRKCTFLPTAALTPPPLRPRRPRCYELRRPVPVHALPTHHLGHSCSPQASRAEKGRASPLKMVRRAPWAWLRPEELGYRTLQYHHLQIVGSGDLG